MVAVGVVRDSDAPEPPPGLLKPMLPVPVGVVAFGLLDSTEMVSTSDSVSVAVAEVPAPGDVVQSLHSAPELSPGMDVLTTARLHVSHG